MQRLWIIHYTDLEWNVLPVLFDSHRNHLPANFVFLKDTLHDHFQLDEGLDPLGAVQHVKARDGPVVGHGHRHIGLRIGREEQLNRAVVGLLLAREAATVDGTAREVVRRTGLFPATSWLKDGSSFS